MTWKREVELGARGADGRPGSRGFTGLLGSGWPGPAPQKRRRAGRRGVSPGVREQRSRPRRPGPPRALGGSPRAGGSGGRGRRAASERNGVRPRGAERGPASGAGWVRALKSASAAARGSCPRGSWTPAVASSEATCCTAPRPQGPAEHLGWSSPATTRAGIGRRDVGWPRRAGAEDRRRQGPGRGRCGQSSAPSWARCGAAEGSATLQVPLRTQGDASLAATSRAARGPGRGEPDALPKFPFADFAGLDLTCEANPGR